MKKVIVTGAGGFIGSALTRLLLDKGVTVYGVDVSEKHLEKFACHKQFIPIIADFTKYSDLHEIITEKEIDVFYHFAWQSFVGEALKDYHLQLSNAIYAADAVTEAIKLSCKKFVFAGTANEIEITDFIDLSGTNPRYTCIYSAAKAAAETVSKTLAHNGGITYSAGLIAMAYGENNLANNLPNVVITQLINGESPKLIKGDIPYDLIYIDDIAEAFYAIGEKGVHLKSYYVGHKELKTFRELLTEIGQTVAPNVELRFGEFPDDSQRDYSKINLNALYDDTGFECKADFKESILKTAEWIKSLNCGEK